MLTNLVAELLRVPGATGIIVIDQASRPLEVLLMLCWPDLETSSGNAPVTTVIDIVVLRGFAWDFVQAPSTKPKKQISRKRWF
jgi:hypothetical protein